MQDYISKNEDKQITKFNIGDYIKAEDPKT
jgi:hypothetical protein